MSTPLDHPLFRHRVVPLASVRDPRHVDAIGDGLAAGGLPVVEVALRGEHGLPALRRLAGRGDLLVGAGTVLSVTQAHEAIEAGASFLVTPGLDAEVVGAAADAGVPIVPGVLTPTEVQAAIGLGLSRLKLFPAGVFDGLALLGAYADVYRDVLFMPSGGIGPANLAEHLSHPAVFAASGSWVVAGASQGAAAVAEAARHVVELTS
ncbi:bifunctional 4-hydroxy-2-oxoglutarate aldolase/2-dehydro-3-deoxy-phosphogluconate aldolase [Microbacterium marinilacus]|uniref:Bifunctional 4-hydroxy-2-oxoglutarate aldolase/2-dehydro-3-deoxy-phosphogluconate aldolase n=1 Tax=Microbacterium marinilacus TaxID=415209 RepID=A0ABP7BWK8_9MICO|nr:bifunctional 4-hydroxy-2-oxoglutarate aldolase/2-dehydro-3-deoxy-phosphogluconate aldolase [Microbacterium marinilacus]MBY0688086.1 bifunctional 4-hydroxy-2-oxoglutarate aldolase/2-dehydro-3-deoxy-phosphogluconate aldolase [Microbacterium marinilacus]